MTSFPLKFVAMADGKEAAQVVSIFIYPIKSCRGISVPEATLSSTGMTYFNLHTLYLNKKGEKPILNLAFHLLQRGVPPFLFNFNGFTASSFMVVLTTCNTSSLLYYMKLFDWLLAV